MNVENRLEVSSRESVAADDNRQLVLVVQNVVVHQQRCQTAVGEFHFHGHRFHELHHGRGTVQTESQIQILGGSGSHGTKSMPFIPVQVPPDIGHAHAVPQQHQFRITESIGEIAEETIFTAFDAVGIIHEASGFRFIFQRKSRQVILPHSTLLPGMTQAQHVA